MPASPDPRLAAVGVIGAVLQHGRSLDAVLDESLAGLGSRDRPLAAQLCYGVLRWYVRLAALLSLLLAAPLRARDRDVEYLLACALYELQVLSTPDYAVVNRSVEAVRKLGKRWAAGLVNAVLRRFLREREALSRRVDALDHQRYALPRWWLESWQGDWPGAWRALAEAGNAQAPMALRVDRRCATREAYLQRLQAAGIAARAHPLTPEAVVLAAPQPVPALPGFADGEVSVQDPAAQLAAGLLELAGGQRVLDACAAPGGKTAHLRETRPDLAELVALEVDARRCARLRENLARCRTAATVIEADARQPDRWWDGRPFARILLDAPCSGSGVIRRHPDIKHLRRAADLPALADRQQQLLEALWPALAGGGMLLYATCSVCRQENEQVIAGFLQRHTDAQEDKLACDWGTPCRHGRQILPGTLGMDGFYYARLRKRL